MIRLQPFGCPLTLAVVASHTSITSPCMRAASQSVGLTLAGTPGLPPLSRGSAAAPLEQAPFSTASIPLRTGRPRLLRDPGRLGTGWAAARLLRDIDPKLYDLAVSHA